MKKVAMGLLAVGVMAVQFMAPGFAAPKMGTFTGEIMDSQCASQGGSHDNMIKVGQSEKDCTNMCVKAGGTYVLYNADTKTIYKLSDQKKPIPFAGEKVKISGDLNDATKTIKVTTIAKA